jgi:hypothetical protein
LPGSANVDPAELGNDYAILGDKDRAFVWLEKAYDEKSDLLGWIKVSPFFDQLRSDPRYAALLKKMGLAE